MPIDTNAVRDALSYVMEPELHQDLITLNFIRDIKIDGNNVGFTIMLTTPACPLKHVLQADSEKALREHGYLTRDSRMKERKKPGQRGARRRFQFSKR